MLVKSVAILNRLTCRLSKEMHQSKRISLAGCTAWPTMKKQSVRKGKNTESPATPRTSYLVKTVLKEAHVIRLVSYRRAPLPSIERWLAKQIKRLCCVKYKERTWLADVVDSMALPIAFHIWCKGKVGVEQVRKLFTTQPC